MTSKMLIDASHPEETRVVVTKGNRVEEFDFESALRKQLRGNIYLAKVTRVEPSLQAAFVDFGGNRHGFLAFSEIHPDYYQIPVADRQALLADEARADADEEEASQSEERRGGRNNRRRRGRPERARRHDSGSRVSESAADDAVDQTTANEGDGAEGQANATVTAGDLGQNGHDDVISEGSANPVAASESLADLPAGEDAPAVEKSSHADIADENTSRTAASADVENTEQPAVDARDDDKGEGEDDANDRHDDEDEDADQNDGMTVDHSDEIIEQIGGDDALEEVSHRSYRPRRQYKIQEVIKRRQILLVQVVKEERGNKGAALTTYLSLAGRYSVLMPNTARGGGISRKITSSEDRKRLKTIAQDLEVPEGMGVILRTAGASRTKVEVKRDFEYLMRLWESVRELTLQSTAPALVYEEGSLVKRAIRDLYTKDVEEVQVAGDEGYREAKDFMKMLMPSHAKMVKPYKEPQPLFARFGVEQQLDAMFHNVVQLRSGGYIVINQTEALVSIDVNSGRATREHNIEDTALKTNLEAAEEVSRQLRLRDLAGLIVIDFIDMEEKRNNRAVERKINDCLKNDRARIQLGRISHFGLLEMSRQRIRTGVLESSTSPCPHCAGTGLKRATASISLNLVRALEEALLKNASYDIVVRTPTEIALYVLNHKREMLSALEHRFGVHISLKTDETILAPQYYQFERGELATRPVQAKTHIDTTSHTPDNTVEEDEVEVVEADAEQDAETTEDSEEESRSDNGRRNKRRRRRRRGGRNGEGEAFNADAQDMNGDDKPGHDGDEGDGEAGTAAVAAKSDDEDEEGDSGDRAEGENGEDRSRRRRRRRGGRRNRRDGADEARETDAGDKVVAADPAYDVEDRDSTSRTIEIRQPDLDIEPDVDVQKPTAIMADEGPVAETNPFNEPEPAKATPTPPAPKAPEPAADPASESEKKKPALFSEEELAAEEKAAGAPKRAGWWSKAKSALGG